MSVAPLRRGLIDAIVPPAALVDDRFLTPESLAAPTLLQTSAREHP